MPGSISHKIHLMYSGEEVWNYLTKPELIEQWLMKSDFEPVEGHEFKFTTKPMPQFDFDGIIHCRVIEVIPRQKLSYSWKGGMGTTTTLDSIVTFTLTPMDSGTELHLEHTGFDKLSVYAFTSMNEGWLKNISRIGSLLDDRRRV